MLNKAFLSALLLTASAHCFANALDVTQFEYVADIPHASSKPYLELKVSKDTYRKSQGHNLQQQLAIVDQADNAINFQLVKTRPSQQLEEWETLPFYRVPNGKQQQDKLTVLLRQHVVAQEFIVQHSVIDASDSHAFLIDARNMKPALTKLRLQWQEPAQAFVSPVVVEISKDLANWRTLGKDHVLSDIRNGDARSVSNELNVSNFQGNMVRISWSASDYFPELKAIEVQTTQWVAGVEPYTHVLSMAYAMDQSGANAFEFVLPDGIPFEQLQLASNEQIVQLQGALYVKHKEGRWRYITAVSWEQNLLTGLKGKPIDIPSHALGERSWKLVIKSESLISDPTRLSIQAQWQPTHLLFVAEQGESYRALLNPAGPGFVPRHTNALSSVFKRMPENIEKLDMPALRLNQAFQPPGFWDNQPWKKLAIWGLLVVALIVMGVMARRLLVQLN